MRNDFNAPGQIAAALGHFTQVVGHGLDGPGNTTRDRKRHKGRHDESHQDHREHHQSGLPRESSNGLFLVGHDLAMLFRQFCRCRLHPVDLVLHFSDLGVALLRSLDRPVVNGGDDRVHATLVGREFALHRQHELLAAVGSDPRVQVTHNGSKLRQLRFPLLLIILHDRLVIHIEQRVFLIAAQFESLDLGFIRKL